MAQADNGWGVHFLQTHRFDPIEAQKQVNRLKRLGVRWALVHYADHDQLVRTAPIFQEADITVIWRPFVRPYESYDSWAEDVILLRSRGLAPYFQLLYYVWLRLALPVHPDALIIISVSVR